MPERVLATLGLVSLVMAGCAAPSSAARPSSAAVRTTVVDLPPSYKFEPVHIAVATGTTVSWTNHDNFSHSVQVDGQSDVHMMRPGESAQITFATPGEYHYICTLHSQNMQGTITVT